MAVSARANVMITYMSEDYEFTKYIADNLRSNGISVWYAERNQRTDSNAIGQAVVECQIFIYVVSPVSAQCSDCKDQLALAYISDKPIFPVALKSFRNLSSNMDSGMKLMLAKINWTFFHKEEIKATSLHNLVEGIRAELRHLNAVELEPNHQVNDSGRDEYRINSHINFSADPEVSREMEEVNASSRPNSSSIKCEFWDRHFQQKTEVPWTEFRDRFVEDYGDRIERNFGEDKIKWFVHLIYRDILDLEKTIGKRKYMEFAGKNVNADPDHFYHRLKKYAIGTQALREVFNIDSTVRLTAIQHLGSYHTPSVVKALFDLVEDPDPNIRAIAALALAKTGKKTTSTKIVDKLIKMLGDEDRLVRESCCLSLAHMRAVRATPCIIDVWRNDAISTVREAAQIAISRMGGKEASQAMKMTQVLQEEIKTLKTGK